MFIFLKKANLLLLNNIKFLSKNNFYWYIGIFVLSFQISLMPFGVPEMISKKNLLVVFLILSLMAWIFSSVARIFLVKNLDRTFLGKKIDLSINNFDKSTLFKLLLLDIVIFLGGVIICVIVGAFFLFIPLLLPGMTGVVVSLITLTVFISLVIYRGLYIALALLFTPFEIIINKGKILSSYKSCYLQMRPRFVYLKTATMAFMIIVFTIAFNIVTGIALSFIASGLRIASISGNFMNYTTIFLSAAYLIIIILGYSFWCSIIVGTWYSWWYMLQESFSSKK